MLVHIMAGNGNVNEVNKDPLESAENRMPCVFEVMAGIVEAEGHI